METYNINLCGHLLKLKTEHNKETLNLFKFAVEEKLKDIQSSHQNISLEKALFLTCLCFAEEKYFLKEIIHKNLNGLESKARNVLKSLESSSQGINLEEANP